MQIIDCTETRRKEYVEKKKEREEGNPFDIIRGHAYRDDVARKEENFVKFAEI